MEQRQGNVLETVMELAQKKEKTSNFIYAYIWFINVQINSF